MVWVILGSANRDPDPFENPAALALAAKRQTRHLGFGHGPHFCLGAPLARLEAEIALETLLRRLPSLRLAVAENELRRRFRFRRVDALPVAWDS
jgi:cytochrome P450